jgi:hypothetical protein
MRLLILLLTLMLLLIAQSEAYAQTHEAADQSAAEQARVLKLLEADRKIVFNVSSLLSCQTSGNLPQIQDSIRKHCPKSISSSSRLAQPATIAGSAMPNTATNPNSPIITSHGSAL